MEIKMEGRCWPTGEQELLLRAALFKGETAIGSWEKWISISNIDQLDQGSYRLLPLLYRNLLHQGIKHPIMNKLKGIYRFTWVKNHRLLQQMVTLLKFFECAEVPAMILKGSALTPLYYKDYGVRPMDDLDLLVRKEQVAESFELLLKLGYHPKEKWPDKNLSYVHATPFIDGNGHELDLHWHLLYECRGKDADEDFWKWALPICIHGIPTFALNPTDQLFHVCVHGAQWNVIPSIRWVADAVKIIGSSPDEMDWNRLGTLAEKHCLVLPIRETLHYLREDLNVPIPQSFLERLKSWNPTRLNKLQYQYKTRSFSEQLLGGLPYDFFNYMYFNSDLGLIRRLWGLPNYFKYMWGLTHVWQVPFRFITNGFRRIGIVLILLRHRMRKAKLPLSKAVKTQ